jgi:hypothetical protein
MILKSVEIRDRNTFVPALAIATDTSRWAGDTYLLRRAGYGPGSREVILVRLADGRSRGDPHQWGGCRTMTTAHDYIRECWDQIGDGAVVDVRTILGETPAPCVSERFEHAQT